MGGYAAARYAQDHPEEVALIAPISPVVSGALIAASEERQRPGHIANWKEKGVLESESRTSPGQIKRAPYAIHEERLNHDLLPNADKLTIPVFLLTGTDDGSCPPDHVQQLFDAIPHDNKVFEIVEDAPHTYRTEGDLGEVKKRLSSWLQSQWLYMNIKKSIQLTSAPLSELIEQGESLDFRLDEPAWKGLEVGDNIEFWEDFTGWQKEPTADARKVVVCIKHIYKAPSFQELFTIIEADGARLENKNKLLVGLRNWWSQEKETTEGVLAFYVAVVSLK